MMKKPITVILFALVLGFPGVASANWNRVVNYQKNDFTGIYLTAALSAFTAANANNNSMGVPPLYCQPPKLGLGPDNAVSIFEQELEYRLSNGSASDPMWQHTGLEFVLLWGLKRTFPCD